MGDETVAPEPTWPAPEPTCTDDEHHEIMRLHIVDGFTIAEAYKEVFDRRTPTQKRPQG